MKQLLHAAAISAVLAVTPALAEEISETRQVSAATHTIHLGGIVSLHVKQGATPSLVLKGEKELVARVTTRQDGSTLVIDMDENKKRWGKNNGVSAELTLPSLKELDTTGVGSSTITGFSGDSLELTLNGAGSLNGDVRYKRLSADIGGVGSVRLDTGRSERIEIDLGGTGSATLNGTTNLLKADLGGVGSLDAKNLQAKTVDLSMSGIGGATVHASEAAEVNMSGLGGATVFGQPFKRKYSATGLGSIKWK